MAGGGGYVRKRKGRELGEVMGAVATREGGTVAYPRPRGGPSERDRVPP